MSWLDDTLLAKLARVRTRYKLLNIKLIWQLCDVWGITWEQCKLAAVTVSIEISSRGLSQGLVVPEPIIGTPPISARSPQLLCWYCYTHRNTVILILMLIFSSTAPMGWRERETEGREGEREREREREREGERGRERERERERERGEG